MFSISALFGVLSLVQELPTLVMNVVVEVENSIGTIPGVSGSSKLAAAEAKINSLLQAAIKDAGVLSSISGVLQPMINAAVAMFNAGGVFTSKSNATGAATPAPAAQ